MTFEPGDPKASRGNRRMRELAERDQADIGELTKSLLASLGRTPTPVDTIAAETLAAAAVRARRLRESGKNDSEERKTILQAIRATGLRPSA
ncbi:MULTISPECIES: hypothetical protein [unclassified Bradyrhizobium]